MRKLAFLALAILGCSVASAQATIDAVQGLCNQGGVSSATSGLQSTNKLDGIIPSCKITVYLTGTQTLATIYSDAAGDVLANPFTAVALGGLIPGQWLFYAADGQGYDVIGSGGIPPNTYPVPVTLCKDCKVGGGGGGGYSLLIEHNGAAVPNQAVLDFNDTTPTPPGGNFASVTFQVDGTGNLSGYVPTYTPPTPINPVQVVLTTSLIGGNACTSALPVTMTGVVAPSGSTPGTTFAVVPEGNPAAVNGWGAVGGLVMQVWVSAANTMSYAVCNQTGSNITPGALTVDVSATTGSGGGGGGGSLISFAAPSANWPSWLVPTVTSPTSAPSLSVAAGPIPNNALANASITLGSTGVALGGTITSAAGFNSATTTAWQTLPTSCDAGNVMAGQDIHGNAIGCVANGGGGGGGGATLQVNSVNLLNQTLQNFLNTSTVTFTNPSGGVINATVPTSAFSVLGVSSPDNVTIRAVTGVYSLASSGTNTIAGFNGSNVYSGFTAGVGISLAGAQITNTSPANAVMTGLSAGQIPEATGPTSLGPSGVTVLGGSTILGSGTSANVDGWGELAISGTTVSYTFSNSYATHPECVATPQFSSAGDTLWITYTSTTSFTIHFAGSQTGNVTYVCFKRT